MVADQRCPMCRDLVERLERLLLLPGIGCEGPAEQLDVCVACAYEITGGRDEY